MTGAGVKSPIGGLRSVWDGPVIDCDVHANVPSLDALDPFQEPLWIQAAQERVWKGPSGAARTYPPKAPTTARAEWRREGTVPASDVSQLQRDVLDPLGVEHAILTCYYGVDSLRHPDWAIALARSVNDWVIAEWLDKDPRLSASVTVPARDPVAAAAEIRRVGGHPGFVQVMMPARAERLYGQRVFWPIYEAMVEHDLVMGITRGGTVEESPSPTGWASCSPA
jgi:predicted TIM-barrel fold metal-dependent hydrolase